MIFELEQSLLHRGEVQVFIVDAVQLRGCMSEYAFGDVFRNSEPCKVCAGGATEVVERPVREAAACFVEFALAPAPCLVRRGTEGILADRTVMDKFAEGLGERKGVR